MSWACVFGVTAGALTMTAVAAAQPPNEAAIRHEAGHAAAPSAPLDTVRLAPQSREISRDYASRTERREVTEPPYWYGWQTLALDGGLLVGSVAMLYLGNDSDSDIIEALAWTPAVAFVVGGPTIHVIHGEYWRALGSFGVRTGLPLIGGALGAGMFATCPPPDGEYGNCGLGELVVGVAAGVLAASLIDGGALARKSAKPHGVALSLAPFVSADGTTRELRLRGQF